MLCVCSLIAEIIFEFRARAVLVLDTLRIFCFAVDIFEDFFIVFSHFMEVQCP